MPRRRWIKYMPERADQCCDSPGCIDRGNHIVWLRSEDKFYYKCTHHALRAVMKDKSPEYEATCPNCHCMFGVK